MKDQGYSFEGNDISTADTGTYLYDFQLSTIDGCDSIIHLALYIMYNDGLSENELPNIEVFPNPVQTLLHIKGENIRQIFIYNADGQLIFSKNDNRSNLIITDVSGHAVGQYVLRVILTDKRTITRKFIINR